MMQEGMYVGESLLLKSLALVELTAAIARTKMQLGQEVDLSAMDQAADGPADFMAAAAVVFAYAKQGD
jgi:hypothetical protein